MYSLGTFLPGADLETLESETLAPKAGAERHRAAATQVIDKKDLMGDGKDRGGQTNVGP
jgi:hypothetical protein